MLAITSARPGSHRRCWCRPATPSGESSSRESRRSRGRARAGTSRRRAPANATRRRDLPMPDRSWIQSSRARASLKKSQHRPATHQERCRDHLHGAWIPLRPARATPIRPATRDRNAPHRRSARRRASRIDACIRLAPAAAAARPRRGPPGHAATTNSTTRSSAATSRRVPTRHLQISRHPRRVMAPPEPGRQQGLSREQQASCGKVSFEQLARLSCSRMWI